MSRLHLRTLAAFVAVLALAACGDDPFEIPTNPDPAVPVTVTFSGTVNRNGAATHTFNTGASGTVTATLTLLAADDGTTISVALGTFNGSACQLVITKDDAVQGSVVTGAVSALGSLCVRISDLGTLAQAADYEIQVSHP